MARVHLDVKFPFEKTPKTVIRFSKKSNRKEVCDQLIEQLNDPTLQNSEVIVCQNNGVKVWMKQNSTLKSLGVESDMTLLIFRNPIRYNFEYNSKGYETSFSPKQTISQIVGNVAERASVLYYLGYSLIPISQGKPTPVNEDMLLCDQAQQFDKILFRIKYYTVLPGDTEQGVPLSRTYSLTRDYLLTGFSPLARKEYILLCSMVAVIESGNDLDHYLLNFDSAHFVRYLPQKLKTDLNSEDDLFDQIQIIVKEDPHLMRKKFVESARNLPNFGYQSFDVQYSVDNDELTYIFCCVGYDGILLLNKKDLTCFDRLKLEDLTYEIDIEGTDKLILNEKYKIFAHSDQILEIESLIKGYKTLKTKLSKIQKLDSKLESIIYNHTIENDLNFLLKIPESVMKVVTPSIEFFFDSLMFEKLTTQVNSATLNSIGDLYFVSSDKRPDFGDFTLPATFDLHEKGKFLLDMLGIISLEIRSGSTSLFDLAQKYGNELRSTVLIVHMMRKQGIDSQLCDDIMISYRVISTKILVEITISKLRGLCVPFSFPSFSYEQILMLSKSLLKTIKASQDKENNDEYIKLYKDLNSVIENIFNIFTGFLNNSDPLKSYDDPKCISDFIGKISYYTPIFALLNEQISLELSSILQNLDSIKIIQIVFPKMQFKVSDLAYSIERIIRSSDDFYNALTDIQMKSRFFFIYDVISILEGLTPKINQKFIEKSKRDELIKVLIKYYSDLLHLKIDPADENAMKYVMACYSPLLALLNIRMIPSQFFYEDKKPTTVDRAKKFKPKIPHARLPKSILPEDEVELSKDYVDKLTLNLTEESNTSINLQDFLDDITKMDPKITSLIQVLEKWRPLIEKANRSDPLFESCKKNYGFALNILRANAERQSNYQSASMLFIKIKHHLQFVKSKAVDTFNKAIFGISEKAFERFEMIDKLPLFTTLLTEIENMKDQDIYTKSLILVLQKFIHYFEPLKDDKFTVPQIVESINTTMAYFNQIFVKLICSQLDDNLQTILITLVYKMMELYEIKKDIIKKALNNKAIQKYARKAVKICKSINSLSIILMDRVFKTDSENFYTSLRNCCWRIIHAKPEVNYHTRLQSLLNEASEQMKELVETLQDKMLKGNSIPQDVIVLLKQKSTEVVNLDNANLLKALLEDLTMLYEKRKFWDVSGQFKSLLITVELAITVVIEKPYVHIYDQQELPNPQILLQAKMDSDSDSTSGNSSQFSSEFSDSRFSSSESSSFVHHSEYVTPNSNAIVAKKGRQLNVRSMSSLSAFSNSAIHISQSDPNLKNLSRPGILLDPIKATQRAKQRPHVTFDLCKDQDSPIFSSNTPSIVDTSIPHEFVPDISPKNNWNFLAWNLPEFIKRLNVPEKLPKIKVKKNSRSSKSKGGVKRFESFSHLTFEMLRLPSYKENHIATNSDIFSSYGSFLYSYQTAEKAIEDIELLLMQCQTCENLFRKMRNSSISERLFFFLDWLSAIATIPMKVTAAKKYDIPQTTELLELYNSIRNELNMIIDDLKIPDFQKLIDAVRQLLVFLDLTKFALQKVENELVQIDLNLKTIVSSWKLYTEDVIDTFHQMIEVDEPMVIIFMRSFVESVFNSYVKFGQYADEIDRETKRQIMTVIQCQLCVQLRFILTNIKKMDLRENSVISTIQQDVETLIQNTEKNELFNDLHRILKEILDALQKRFMFADADWYSLQLKHFIDSRIGIIEKTYLDDPDSSTIQVFYQIMSLRHNILSMRFAASQNGQTTFMTEIDEVIEDLRKLSSSFTYAQSMKDGVTTRKICEKWTFSFNLLEDSLKELKSVAILMLNSTSRLKIALKFLKKVGSELIKIENPKFPFDVSQSYESFTSIYTKLIDYVLNKLNAGHSYEDMVLDYDTVSKMPSVKVTPFVNSYKTYYQKVEDYIEGKEPNSDSILLLRLFLTHLKVFSRKFGGSYTSIKETITSICNSMKVVVPKIKTSKLKETFIEQDKQLNLLRVNDDSPICSAEIRILQQIVQVGELVVAIINFNLDFMLSSTSNSKLLLQMIKNNEIEIDCSFFKNNLSFNGKFDIFEKQLELFEIINQKAKQSLLIENPFGFTKSELSKLSKIQINGVPNSASISSVVKAHDYIISKFTSLFFFNSSSRFIKEVKKFASNASLYFGYYHMQQNVVLLEKTNQIVKALNNLFKNFENLDAFKHLFFEIIDLSDKFKKRLEETADIEKDESKADRVDKIMSLIVKVSDELKKKKSSKEVFHSLFDFIEAAQNVSRLHLRLMFDYHDMISFLFALTDLVENKEDMPVKELQLLLQILMKTNLPIADELCDKIASYLDSNS